jgi:acyl transferase domain-containing protein
LSEPIAVIGMACRFPAADGIEEYWNSLLAGHSAISRVPDTRGVDFSGLNAQGGFIPDIERFDAGFFGIGAEEAVCVDPQQRLLLETTWTALERGGIVPASLRGTDSGVFVAVGAHDFSVMLWPHAQSQHAGTGASGALAANRISYFLGTHGPSITVDTACSSSLVAMHLACRSITGGDCEMALVGGANILLVPGITDSLHRAGKISPDGLCRSFGAAANGFVRSEGAGMVVLKRWDAACRDGDRILCAVLASATNHNGRGNGLGAPNPEIQRELIERALGQSGVHPDAIGYVEAGATGTLIGDAIEWRAIREGLAAKRGGHARTLYVGSMKSNLGHLEAAGGIAGFIKAALIAERGLIPPSLHSESPNPLCKTDTQRLAIPQEVVIWDVPASERHACVNSFGFGGANAHVILSGVDTKPSTLQASAHASSGTYFLPLSARSESGMTNVMSDWQIWCENHDVPLRDLCGSASVHRSHFTQFRAGVLVRDRSDLVAAFRGAAVVRPQAGACRVVIRADLPPPQAHLRVLFETNAAFREIVHEVDQGLSGRSGAFAGYLRHGAAGCAPTTAEAALIAAFCMGRWLSRLVTGSKLFMGGDSSGELVCRCLLSRLSLQQAILLLKQCHSPGADAASRKDHDSAGPVLLLQGGAESPAITAFDALARPAGEFVAATLQYLYLAGTDLDWTIIHPRGSYERVTLPAYPFQRERFWPLPERPSASDHELGNS